MNKSKLIGQIAADTGMTRAAIKAVLNSFIDNTTEALQEGDTVVFQGFGTFLPWEQTERPARNPHSLIPHCCIIGRPGYDHCIMTYIV